MARWSTTRVLRGLALLLVVLPASRSGLAQTALTLAELNARTPRDYGAVHARQEVSIRGTVNAPPFHFPEYTILTIQDATSGAALHTPLNSALLDAFLPGDVVEASGSVITLGGMVMVDVGRVKKVRRAAGFQAATATLDDLHRFSVFGRLVRTKGRLVGRGSTTAGPFLLIGSDKDFYKIFFPVREERFYPALPQMQPGDAIEAVGVAFQYAAGRPPYNRGYELLATEPPAVAAAVSGWWWSPLAVLAAILAVGCGALLMAARERRLRRQRELLRKTYQLGEEIFSAASTAQVQKRLDEALPAVLGVTRVRLYRYDRSAKQLDAVSAASGEPVTISLSAPTDGPQAGAVACFHYRSLLAIPDVSRSPFPIAAGEGPNPKSLLFVPMMAQGEVAGVLELDQDDRVRDFSAAEQSLAQHLGNQVGVALRMLDQRSVQEQLSRTEKLAAVGRLISSIVNELEAPLASIQELAGQARERVRQAPVERELAAIEAETQKAASMVARLVTFASSEQVEARPVAVGDLLLRLIDFREGDWRASGIRVRDLVFREPLKVLGSHGQLEQVFLNLLVHAEQALAGTQQKTLTIRTSVLAKRLLVEISFSAPGEWRNVEETTSVLGLTQSVVAGHGGEVRLIDKNDGEPRFEVELPLVGRERPAAAAGAPGAEDAPRLMTALVIEPDGAVERQLVALLERSGARAIPLSNADTALELAGRARIDVAFCSVHAPGLNWVELSERMRLRVGAFVLMPDHYDAELTADFEGENCFVLPKPIQEAELADVLAFAERAPLAKVVSIKNGVA